MVDLSRVGDNSVIDHNQNLWCDRNAYTDSQVREAMKAYISKKGAELAQLRFHEIIKDYDRKPIGELMDSMVQERIPFSTVVRFDRIIRGLTVELWRDIFGEALKEVNS